MTNKTKRLKKKLTLEQNLALIDAAMDLVFISLFAGCGGSSLGYKLAGLKELLAIEWDSNARASFAQNFPHVPVKDWDISKLTPEEILNEIRLKVGQLQVFDASPPCVNASTANTFRDPDAASNALYISTLKLIGPIQSAAFVAENVSGLVKGKMKIHFNRIVDELEKQNYYCERRTLNASEYGVPQDRDRCYIIGVRRDIYDKFGPFPLFPEPDLKLAKKMRVCDVLPHIKFYSPGQFADKRHKSDKPVCTITKTASAWVYEKDGIRRKPTIEELKVLSSFPKDFKLTGSFLQQWARIGNAVPPNLAKAIGLHLKKVVFTKQVKEYMQTKEALAYAARMAKKYRDGFGEDQLPMAA